MRILLIKMSSMGDVFHTFPALTDAMQALPDLQVDWVVEEAFAEIPAWHPVVDQVFPIGLRRWRKHPFQSRSEVRQFFEQLCHRSYDKVLDAQGLLKSVWVARKIPAPKVGLDWHSVREPLASLFYDQKIHVPQEQHAITRLRQFFAQALEYDWQPHQPIVYGLRPENENSHIGLEQKAARQAFVLKNYVVGLHGTTWETKLWPESHWIELGQKLLSEGKQLVLPWGNEQEQQRARRIQQQIQASQSVFKDKIWVPTEQLSLNEMVALLKSAVAVVSVDTGLSH
ncbi:MAG TPA: lipopolysaccharide heptosyltransferase I, partial [Desulfobacterales bacterium]|nr:lipopolysaccharide heptosyltransferase I [Desulfobacterales bacterium]